MTRPSAVVIGAGFGGLALAVRLQASGVQTTLVDQRDRPGGRAYVYEDEGFTFDAGPTVITALNAVEELFRLAGRELGDYVEMLPVDPFYRLVWPDGFRLEYNADIDFVVAQIAARSPADAAGYRRFIAYSEDVFREGYLKLGHVPFLDWWSMLRVLPQLVRLQSYRTVYGVVSDFIQDPQLRQAFSFQSLLIGGNPFSVSSIYALIHALERRWGVFFPRGGTGALVAGLSRLFQDLGGELRLGSPVDAIVVKGGRAREAGLADGASLKADILASNADVVHTYQHLLRGEHRGRAEGRRLARRRHSMSLFVVYFGLRGHYPELAHHTVLFGPRYRELLADIFDRGVLAEDFSLYLHAPTKTDASLAPEGCSTFYALTPVPHLGKAELDWDTAGPLLAERILDRLEQTCLPGLRQNIVTKRLFTPRDFAHELNAHLGSAFSLEPLLTQSAYFRVHNRDAKIPNLYFVGAGTHPGAGVPGVIGSAQATAGLVLHDLGRG